MNTVDQLLADTGDVDGLRPEGLARGRDALNHALGTIERTGLEPRVARRGNQRRRLTLAGVTAVAAAVVITIPVVSLGDNGPSASADAATVLREAGVAAGAQPGGWPDAAYWHVTSTYTRDGKTYHRDIWFAHHGESVLHDTGLPGDPGFLPGAGTFAAGGETLTWDQLYVLPTDPNKLKAALRTYIDGAGPDAPTELFVMVGDLLRESPASPALRKALYDVAADIPGVHVTGQVTDGVGRPGTAVEYGGETYVIDKSNGQLLVDEDSGWTSTYLSQGPADSAPSLTTK